VKKKKTFYETKHNVNNINGRKLFDVLLYQITFRTDLTLTSIKEVREDLCIISYYQLN